MQLYSVFILSESWLKPHISSDDYFDPSLFKVFRKDRIEKKGGGVLVAISNKFKVTSLEPAVLNYNQQSIDFLGLIVKKNTISFLLLAIYIPPDISITNFSSFFSDLETCQHLHSYSVIFAGDFNCPNYFQSSQHLRDPKSIILTNFLSTYNLQQTNFSLNCSGKLLDLVCSSVACITTKADYPIVPFDKYHPPPLFITAKLESTHKGPRI